MFFPREVEGIKLNKKSVIFDLAKCQFHMQYIY